MQARARQSGGDAFDEVANLTRLALHTQLDDFRLDKARNYTITHEPERRVLRVGEPDIATRGARNPPTESFVNGGVHPGVDAVNDSRHLHTLTRLRVTDESCECHPFDAVAHASVMKRKAAHVEATEFLTQVTRALRQTFVINILVEIAARYFALAIRHVQAHDEALIVLLIRALEGVEVRPKRLVVFGRGGDFTEMFGEFVVIKHLPTFAINEPGLRAQLRVEWTLNRFVLTEHTCCSLYPQGPSVGGRKHRRCFVEERWFSSTSNHR